MVSFEETSFMPTITRNILGPCTPIKTSVASIVPEDIGDDDCRKLVFDVWASGVPIASFRTEKEAYLFCLEKGLEVC